VHIKPRIVRQISKLPAPVKKSLIALIREIELEGQVRGNWPNYSRLGKNRHHCHLKKRKANLCGRLGGH